MIMHVRLLAVLLLLSIFCYANDNSPAVPEPFASHLGLHHPPQTASRSSETNHPSRKTSIHNKLTSERTRDPDNAQIRIWHPHPHHQPSLHETQQHAFLGLDTSSIPPLDVVPLIISGPSHNRVDLIFFSDGYLQEEHTKFIEDAQRLANDISKNQTFHTVKPLLNFWAAFSPSKESGIGVGGVAKDTPFGLFRDGTELRGVYYSKPEVARASCDSLGPQCNFPILLGNDPLYGGLGGEFTVVTSSFLNGPLVLRHELGHSIITVGEEYDGGFAYFGPNAAHDLSQPLPWAHWLSDTQPHLLSGTPRIEKSVMPMQAYAWTMLNTTDPWSITFNSSGAYNRHLLKFSLSGIPHKSDLRVKINGVDLGWEPEPTVGLDRWHYDIRRANGLVEGEHEVKFIFLNPSLVGVAQLCSVEVLEFGDQDEFISTPGYYGIFPTFSMDNGTSYRPTDNDCLMRAVTTPNFCKVCTEGLWLSLLSHVDLIDDITESCEWRFGLNAWVKIIDLRLIPLAQFRTANIAPKESYTITWKREGELVKEFTNMTRLEMGNSQAVATYTIMVKFDTEEVRVKDGLLVSGTHYNVVSKCA